MEGHNIWHTEPSGIRAAEKGSLRLVILPPAPDGQVRFLVMRHPRNSGRYPYAIIASGTESDLCAAKAAAERMADRLVATMPRAVQAATDLRH